MKDKAFNQSMSLLCIAIGTAFVTRCLFFYFFDGAMIMTECCMKGIVITSLVLIGLAIGLLLGAAGCTICGKIAGNQEPCCIAAQLGQDAKIILVHKDGKDSVTVTRCKKFQDAFSKMESGDKLYICEKKARLNRETLQLLKSKIDNLKEITICFGSSDCSGTICCEVEAQTTNSAEEK